MINGLANNIASQITQTDRSTELWKHGACYVTGPMNDGVSPNNRRRQWHSSRAMRVFILLVKEFMIVRTATGLPNVVT
jgi:hypothetical protein